MPDALTAEQAHNFKTVGMWVNYLNRTSSIAEFSITLSIGLSFKEVGFEADEFAKIT